MTDGPRSHDSELLKTAVRYVDEADYGKAWALFENPPDLDTVEDWDADL